MKRIIIITLLAWAAWQGYGEYKAKRLMASATESAAPTAAPLLHDNAPGTSPTGPQFNCDGRTHCSQMTSCAEAIYFLRNCPGVKMDGDNDGIPCERQFCGN